MKLKYFLAILLFIIILIITINSNKKKPDIISSYDYQETVKLGLEKEGLLEDNILYTEKLKNDEEIIFFTDNKSIGFAFLLKREKEWFWIRNETMYGFENNNKSNYMISVLESETINKNKYNIFLGQIFEPNIYKITFIDDMIKSKIVNKNGNIFCLAVVEKSEINNKNFYINPKAYDKFGEIIKNEE
jgi:hypothetical protein